MTTVPDLSFQPRLKLLRHTYNVVDKSITPLKSPQITAPDIRTTRALLSSFESPQPTNISTTGTNTISSPAMQLFMSTQTKTQSTKQRYYVGYSIDVRYVFIYCIWLLGALCILLVYSRCGLIYILGIFSLNLRHYDVTQCAQY